ncbi:MAG: serine/threonine protein kinase [Anaerolineae bacterium]|nr:serine/threonine protein kinase [Anaerolineae bacterium]
MPNLDESLLGRTLDEYVIEKPLGAGGMASVYLALDTRLQRYVALKVIAPDFRTDKEYAQRLESEARSIARLDHPHIVQIYRFGEVGDLYYMAMQYIDGADLDKVVSDYRANGEVLGLNDIARITRDIGSALDYAHGKGVVHRDVKPGNIMLDKNGRAWLTDFGLALLGDSGASGTVFGSPLYISPEQARSGANVVPQSDLYSLGIVLFYMLTGRLPFVGTEAAEVVEQHLSQKPPRPSDFNPVLPPSINAVVLKALEKDPQQRYQTGSDLSAALDAALVAGMPEKLPEFTAGLHLSQLRVPEKVEQISESLPPLFDSGNAPTMRESQPQIPHDTMASIPVQPAPQRQYIPHQSPVYEPKGLRSVNGSSGSIFGWISRHQLPVAIGMISLMLLVCCWGAYALIFSPRINYDTPTAAATDDQAALITATALPATAALPTLLPTPTTFTQPTAFVFPTFTPFVPPTVPPLPTTIRLPPSDRSFVPAGSARLGEFAVEWYCNERGLGVSVINNDSDWACNNNDGTINFVLQAADFDRICQRTYNDQGAFAILDQQKPTRAYNWSCYRYL